MDSQIDEINAALVDVRRAYRLIHLYQRRVLELCREITEAFETELTFYQWGASHVDMPARRGTDPLSRWAWDFLPLYDFCVLYLPEGVHNHTHKPDDWMLAVRVAADSGFVRKGGMEPDPRSFETADTCESSVKLYIYYCSEAFDGNWYYDIYMQNDFPPDDRKGSFIKGIIIVGMKFALAEMHNVEAVQNRVHTFRQELQQVFPTRTTW